MKLTDAERDVLWTLATVQNAQIAVSEFCALAELWTPFQGFCRRVSLVFDVLEKRGLIEKKNPQMLMFRWWQISSAGRKAIGL